MIATAKSVGASFAKKKGGSMYPRLTLEQAIGYARKLVSKTHTGPQPQDIVFKGVFGAGASRGQIRASALKQYGLMKGPATDYDATDLARAITSAPPDELPKLFAEACLKPRVFRVLFDTFHGDEVSPAKLKQQAAAAKVHPEELDSCVETFVDSVVFAGLAARKGDVIELRAAKDLSDSRAASAEQSEEENEEESEAGNGGEDEQQSLKPLLPRKSEAPADERPSARAVIQVNVSLDSSLDTDKLEKQLALLRRYGAI